MEEAVNESGGGEQHMDTITELSVSVRHEAFLSEPRAALLAGGELLLCQCNGGVNCVRVNSGRVECRLEAAEDAVHVFAASSSSSAADGTATVLCSHQSALLRLWTLNDGGDTGTTAGDSGDEAPDLKRSECVSATLVHTWRSLHSGPVTGVVFDQTGTLAASGGAGDASVRVWDTERHHCTHSFRCSNTGAGTVRTLAFYQPSTECVQLLASAEMTVTAEIYCWSLNTGRLRFKLTGHFATITSLTVVHEYGLLVSGGRDKVLMVWNVADESHSGGGELVKTLPVGEPVESVAVVKQPDTTITAASSVTERVSSLLLISGGHSGVVRVWSGADSRCINSSVASDAEEKKALSPISQLMMAAGGDNQREGLLAAVTTECTVTLYQVPALGVMRQLVGYRDQVLDVAFCSDGSSNRCENHLVVVTNSASLKLYRRDCMDSRILDGHKDMVMAVSVCASDRTLLASASKDGTARVWRLRPNNDGCAHASCVAQMSGHTASVTCVAWSQLSASHILTGADDRCVKIWRFNQTATVEDGATSSSVRDATVVSLQCFWSDIAHVKSVNAVCWSPNDRLLATASQDKTARLYRWRPSDSERVAVLVAVMRGHTRAVWHVVFSPVDQLVATGSADGTVRLWSVAEPGACVRVLEGSGGSVLRCVFVGGGRQVLGSTADGALHVWTAATGECRRSYDQHAGARVWALAVSSDQRCVVSGDVDAALLEWTTVTDSEHQERTVAAEAVATVHKQKLNNLIQQQRWLPALQLAIRLERPAVCLDILQRLLRQHQLEPSADSERVNDTQAELAGMLATLRDDQLATLLKFAVEWNTNTRYCQYAQTVLMLVFRQRTPAQWCHLPDYRRTLEALLPYTQRHIDRLRRLECSVTFIDYTASCLNLPALPAPPVDASVEESNTDSKIADQHQPSHNDDHHSAEDHCWDVDGLMVSIGGDDDEDDDNDRYTVKPETKTASETQIKPGNESKRKKRFLSDKGKLNGSVKKKRSGKRLAIAARN